MPTYDYSCIDCGHKFEQFQKIVANPLRYCPRCNNGKLKRHIGKGSAVLFKGSGFYETDYKKSNDMSKN